MNGPLRLKPNLRRALPAAVVAVAAFVVGEQLGGLAGTTAEVGMSLFGWRFTVATGWAILIVVGITAVFLVSAVLAVRLLARELDEASRDRAGIAAGSAIRLVCLIVGYLTVAFGVLALLRVDVGNLLVGGAVTGVVIGIAAQQTLGNFFAGLVLLFSRPYVPGQRITVHTGAMGGPFEGVVTVSGLMYTTITTDRGEVRMPNAGLLAAAIGPPGGATADEDPAPADVAATVAAAQPFSPSTGADANPGGVRPTGR
ncbi:mechanosensitive ion channel domain-containing protein [Nakamurella endophytica]|uniref:Mechanosensitive ion channel MscS domain-containing protein n=1 Tax=Nakamurella endophytica TaxID=1748367 RepID=A0A917SPG2_9ACTN|nr:mechanosensitive ion channel family protein [Nakamurella endophytica]GGL89814.1 hypothetical protein GCM10011594_06820 [Nakamurella endophytica]